MSALIYELLKLKGISPPPHPISASAGCLEPTPQEQSDYPLRAVKIHLVGHSYGAKLMAFAGMEALRRWVLVDHMKMCDIAASRDKESHRKRNEVLQAFGQGRGNERKRQLPFLPDEDQAGEVIDELYHRMPLLKEDSLIESLVMINPAIHPGEFQYPTDSYISVIPQFAPVSILKLIPRKTFVYSKTDYANGMLFNVREIVLNTQVSQVFHSYLEGLLHHNHSGPARDVPGVKAVFQMTNGAFL